MSARRLRVVAVGSSFSFAGWGLGWSDGSAIAEPRRPGRVEMRLVRAGRRAGATVRAVFVGLVRVPGSAFSDLLSETRTGVGSGWSSGSAVAEFEGGRDVVGVGLVFAGQVREGP